MQRNEIERGIDSTQLWGILYLRWRIIGTAMAAVFAIAFLPSQITGGGPDDKGTPIVQQTFTASATYAVFAADMNRADKAVDLANSFADALAETDAYSTIDLGGLQVRLEIVEIAEEASLLVGPTAPAAPRTIPMPITLIAVGLFIGVVMALFVEWADGRANWPAQVIDTIGLPSIGNVHDQRDGESEIEAYGAAKTRIKNILPNGPRGRSLLVTSAHSRHGKTTVVSNLARSIAEDGSTVVILSADVRSANSIDANWPGNEYRTGLSEYLSDQSIEIDDIVTCTPESGISLVTRGLRPDSVVPLVDSRRMSDLLAELGERADWILIDGSAALESADAARFSPLVAGTLLVVDGHHTTLSSARSATGMLTDAGAEMIGFFHIRTRGNPVARMLRHEMA